MSASIAARLSMVSSSDSPLEVDEVLMLRLTTSADRRLAAISKVVRVRVEFSKNRLKTDLPRSSGTFLTSRSDTPTKFDAVSRMRWIISRDRPSIDKRCWSSPSGRSWGCRMVAWMRLGSPASGEPQREAAIGLARELEARLLVERMDRATVAGLDRQLPAAPVYQHREFDPVRPAVVEELVQGRAHRATGVENVVDQHQVGALDIEGQFRLARLGRQVAPLAVLVAAHSGAEGARPPVEAQVLVQALGDPGAATVDADQPDGAPGDAGANLLEQPGVAGLWVDDRH